MNKSIFHIQNEYLQLANQLQENGGELTPEIEQALAINQEELEVKSVGYAAIIRHLDSYIDTGKGEIDRIKGLIESAEKAKERLKANIKSAMLTYGVDSIEKDLTKINFRKSTAVEITDESLIPGEYKETKTTETISKKNIGEALKAGKEVPGATLVENKNLQIK